MTREEAIKEINTFKIGAKSELGKNALDMAIKALEQEPILDKIKAEIVEEMLSHSGTGEEVIQAYADGLKKGLAIIDKYKSESEDKE
jgi:hypothetical protein